MESIFICVWVKYSGIICYVHLVYILSYFEHFYSMFFSLYVLSIGEGGVLKSCTIKFVMVNMKFKVYQYFFYELIALICTLQCSLGVSFFDEDVASSPTSSDQFWFQVYFFRY